MIHKRSTALERSVEGWRQPHSLFRCVSRHIDVWFALPLTYQCIIKAGHHLSTSETPFDSNGVSLAGRWCNRMAFRWRADGGMALYPGWDTVSITSVFHFCICLAFKKTNVSSLQSEYGQALPYFKTISWSLLRANSNEFFAQTACANIYAHSKS